MTEFNIKLCEETAGGEPKEVCSAVGWTLDSAPYILTGVPCGCPAIKVQKLFCNEPRGSTFKWFTLEALKHWAIGYKGASFLIAYFFLKSKKS